MGDNSKEIIRDKTLFQNIFGDIFPKNQVLIKTGELRKEIKFLAYQNDTIKLNITEISDLPKRCIIFTRYEETLYSALIQFISKDRESNYSFKPIEVRKYHTPTLLNITLDRSQSIFNQ